MWRGIFIESNPKLHKNAYKSKVVDTYGMQEIGDIAVQCPSLENHYHIYEESVIVELVDEYGNLMKKSDNQLGNSWLLD